MASGREPLAARLSRNFASPGSNMSPAKLNVVLTQSAMDEVRHLGEKRQKLFNKATKSLARNPSQGTPAHAPARQGLRFLRLDRNLRILFEIDEKLGQLRILAVVGRGGIH